MRRDEYRLSLGFCYRLRLSIELVDLDMSAESFPFLMGHDLTVIEPRLRLLGMGEAKQERRGHEHGRGQVVRQIPRLIEQRVMSGRGVALGITKRLSIDDAVIRPPAPFVFNAEDKPSLHGALPLLRGRFRRARRQWTLCPRQRARLCCSRAQRKLATEPQ